MKYFTRRKGYRGGRGKRSIQWRSSSEISPRVALSKPERCRYGSGSMKKPGRHKVKQEKKNSIDQG